jgi:hypothetical protein
VRWLRTAELEKKLNSFLIIFTIFLETFQSH